MKTKGEVIRFKLELMAVMLVTWTRGSGTGINAAGARFM